MNDIGNLHVIDYYLYHATTYDHSKPPWVNPIQPPKEIYDFDISTEQREGWTYDDYPL